MTNNSVIVIQIVISGVFGFDSLWSWSGRNRPFERKKVTNNKGNNVRTSKINK